MNPKISVDFTNLINILVSEISRSSNEAKEISKILAMFSEINAGPFVRVIQSIEKLLNEADLYGVRNDALTIFGNIRVYAPGAGHWVGDLKSHPNWVYFEYFYERIPAG